VLCRDSAGNDFSISQSMAFLTGACTTAGSSNFRWPVTPIRTRYGIGSKSAIAAPGDLHPYHELRIGRITEWPPYRATVQLFSSCLRLVRLFKKSSTACFPSVISP
jgi:hypothetical protein